ncbi:MAG TPA: hypothetical protein VFF84_06370 [Sphingobium sp.]|nr:hypothetical protein [Sphingobium sp.]
MTRISPLGPLTVNRRALLMAGVGAALCPHYAFGQAPALLVPPPDPDAPEAPAAIISNGLVSATLLLPDPAIGYYRGTRFDWSGLVARLEVGGHSYFGRWFADYDPKKHDAVMGPAQDWVTGQGFEQAEVGGTFVKVGVGVLRKPAEPIRGFPTLEIVDPGTWTVTTRVDAVEFLHEVNDPLSGYGYRYHKTVLLPTGLPELVLEQRLEATGPNPIDTQMYNHNFFVLDRQPSGPDIEITFPFELEPFNMRGDAVKLTGNRINYVKPVEGSVRMQIRGFGDQAADNAIRVENRATGAGVLVTTDKPLSDLVFWSSPTTTCPEAYIHVRAEPGQPMKWQTRYQFYSLAEGAAGRP